MSFKPTVMPKEEKKIDNLGTPGLQIPNNAESIKEFSEVSNVNAKELNAALQAKDALKSATPGIHIPKNADEIKEFKEVSTESAKELNAKLNG